MNAPDKIYVTTILPGFLRNENNSVEYIRKDALLEWAEQQEKQALEELVNGLPLNGKLSAFHRVVEKIESM